MRGKLKCRVKCAQKVVVFTGARVYRKSQSLFEDYISQHRKKKKKISRLSFELGVVAMVASVGH